MARWGHIGFWPIRTIFQCISSCHCWLSASGGWHWPAGYYRVWETDLGILRSHRSGLWSESSALHSVPFHTHWEPSFLEMGVQIPRPPACPALTVHFPYWERQRGRSPNWLPKQIPSWETECQPPFTVTASEVISQSFCHLFEEMDASCSQEGSVFKSNNTDHLVLLSLLSTSIGEGWGSGNSFCHLMAGKTENQQTEMILTFNNTREMMEWVFSRVVGVLRAWL